MARLGNNIWHWCEAQARDKPFLALLLFIDCSFIVIHVVLWCFGSLSAELNVTRDNSAPEIFNYLKWTVCTLSCAFLFYSRRALLYGAWAVLFLYLYLDDSGQLHERYGSTATTAFDLAPAWGLRAQDFGELTVAVIMGTVLFLFLAIAYFRADLKDGSRQFTKTLLPWLLLLIFFGVVVDMVHIQIGIFRLRWLYMLFGVIEDGGEMIAASFLTAGCVREVFLGSTYKSQAG